MPIDYDPSVIPPDARDVVERLYDAWTQPVDSSAIPALPANVSLMSEKEGVRNMVRPALRALVADHFYGLNLIAELQEYEESLARARELLPTMNDIKTRSGDLGEVLATAYVEQRTSFDIPVKKLRYKDDRALAMRGNDIVAFDKSMAPPRVLKGEVKSRSKLSNSTVQEAAGALIQNAGRPKAATLAFIAHKLRMMGNTEEAKLVEAVQKTSIPAGKLQHFIFTLSGNDPSSSLSAHAASAGGVERMLVGLRIDNHQDFIREVFDSV